MTFETLLDLLKSLLGNAHTVCIRFVEQLHDGANGFPGHGASLLLLEVFCTPGVDSICRQVQRQLLRNEAARFYHHCARKCLPPRKLRRDIQ